VTLKPLLPTLLLAALAAPAALALQITSVTPQGEVARVRQRSKLLPLLRPHNPRSITEWVWSALPTPRGGKK
jgi:hypothetical protein